MAKKTSKASTSKKKNLTAREHAASQKQPLPDNLNKSGDEKKASGGRGTKPKELKINTSDTRHNIRGKNPGERRKSFSGARKVTMQPGKKKN